MTGDLFEDGFTVLGPDPRIMGWAAAAHPLALAVAQDAGQRARWLRHGGTWFVGVDALPTDAEGGIGDTPLAGPWDEVAPLPGPLHPAQLSIVYPGYPGRDPDEAEAAHRFRRDRDAAHLDGLRAEGPDKRRHLREPHAVILGLPLTAATASPTVVWVGSHEVIREAFLAAFAGLPPALWPEQDVTAIYREARVEVFETCERVELHVSPGEAILIHRLAIHGIAPWGTGTAPPEGRMIAWFRPLLVDIRDWLRAP